MNKKNIIRYILDLILAIGFMLMYDKMAIGMKLHELLGLGLGVGVIVHLILNYKWVISIGKKIFSKDLNKRTRFLYLINLLLLVCMILIMVGGIFISKTILTSISSQNHGLWKVIHVVASNIALILIGISKGRFILDIDVDYSSKVVVLGSEIANTLFGLNEPIGKTINLNGIPYKVVGDFNHKVKIL